MCKVAKNGLKILEKTNLAESKVEQKTKSQLTSVSTRLAIAADIDHSLLAVSVVSGSHLASPQAG